MKLGKFSKAALTSAVIAGAALFSSGCVSKNLDDAGNFRIRNEGRIEVINYKPRVGAQYQTTPVHPGDADFLTGNTTTNAGGEVILSFAMTPAIEAGYKFADKSRLSAYTGLRVGLDVESRGTWKGYRKGMYDVSQQSSDIRPEWQGSFCYSKIEPAWFRFVPVVGLEYQREIWGVQSGIGIEAGLPHNEFEVTSGWDRYGKWEEYQSNSWSGNGKSYGAHLTLGDLESKAELRVGWEREDYDMEKMGKIWSDVYYVGFLVKF